MLSIPSSDGRQSNSTSKEVLMSLILGQSELTTMRSNIAERIAACIVQATSGCPPRVREFFRERPWNLFELGLHKFYGALIWVYSIFSGHI